VYAVSIGRDFSNDQGKSHLDTVAWSSTAENNPNLIWNGEVVQESTVHNANMLSIPDVINLSVRLQELVDVPKGALLDNDTTGADGWGAHSLYSITYGGQEYVFDDAHPSHTIQTAAGVLIVSSDGQYILMNPINGTATVEYVAQNADGSTSTAATLSLNVDNGAVTIVRMADTGTAGHNILYGSSADDTINRICCNDTFYGCYGNDTSDGRTGNDILFSKRGMTRSVAEQATIFCLAAPAMIPLRVGTGMTRCSAAPPTIVLREAPERMPSSMPRPAPMERRSWKGTTQSPISQSRKMSSTSTICSMPWALRQTAGWVFFPSRRYRKAP